MTHGTDIQIRLVARHEQAELRRVRLSALAYSPHLADHLAKEAAAPAAFWRERAELASSAKTMATFVAVEENGFVGIVDGFLADGRMVEIGGMWVHPDRRRTGIGGDLLSVILGWARERGATRAGLWVRASNTPARLLYERDGFEPAKTSDAGLRLETSL